MKDSYVTVLLEDINHKFDICVQMAGDVAEMKIQIKGIFERLDSIDNRIYTFDAAIKDTSRQVNNHEARIGRLETA